MGGLVNFLNAFQGIYNLWTEFGRVVAAKVEFNRPTEFSTVEARRLK